MSELHKSKVKFRAFALGLLLLGCFITHKGEALYTERMEIYRALTNDTIPYSQLGADSLKLKTNKVLRQNAGRRDTLPADSVVFRSDTARKDTGGLVQKIDTFSLKLSKDTLSGPVDYEAEDSAVLLIREKKFLLYGKTKTSNADVTLSAPYAELDQQTSLIKARGKADSTGYIAEKVSMKQGGQSFLTDSLTYNIKTQKGITRNTYTKQQELNIQGLDIKKVDSATTFVKRAVITTCDYDEPHFAFVSSKAKFINKKLAITGPIHPEFEGVPVPIILPFGIFPMSQGRHSGMLPPQFIVDEQRGLGLTGIGYYQVINNYYDVTFRGDVYSYGSWNLAVVPTYRKRYRYNGGINFSLQRTKFNFKGDPDFSLNKTFSFQWNHNVDSKARPGQTFNANVNVSSTRYNSLLAYSPLRNIQNTQTSSVAYSKSWSDPTGRQYNLTLSANHTQNNNLRYISVTLPDASFTVSTFYPFAKKEAVGNGKWYEKLGVGYSGTARNQLSFYDTSKLSFKRLLDTMQVGAQHNFPISMSLPPVGPLIFSPSVSYSQTWFTRKIYREWNQTRQKVDTAISQRGFYTDHNVSFGLSMNTAIYGTYVFKKGRVEAIRHVIRPNFGMSYRPNISRNNYDYIQIDTLGNKRPLSQFDVSGNLFSYNPYGRFGGITFGIDNNLEMKVHNRKDSTNASKKIRLIDGFSINSSYNFLDTAFKLTPFQISLRSTLFEKINITASGVLDPYQRSPTGQPVNKLTWQGDKFSLGRINSGSISASTSFQSKRRDGSDAKDAKKPGTTITDPTLLNDAQRLADYIQRNPAEFVDFDLPWSVNLSYSLSFTQLLRQDYSYQKVISSSLNFNNTFSLAPKWQFSTNGYIDVNARKLTLFQMSISRDMHCWQMSINVNPIGNFRYFNFTISPKSGLLRDLKVNRTRSFTNY